MGTISDNDETHQVDTEKDKNAHIPNGECSKDDELVISSGHSLGGSVVADESEEWKGKGLNLGSKFRLLTRTDQIWEFQTVIRGTFLRNDPTKARHFNSRAFICHAGVLSSYFI